MKMHVSSRYLMRFTALLLLLGSVYFLYRNIRTAQSIAEGYTEIRLITSGSSPQDESRTVRGAGSGIRLPEQIVIRAPEDLSRASRIGVCCMGLFRTLPVILCLLGLSLVLARFVRHGGLAPLDVKLILAGGWLLLWGSLLNLPVNYLLIPRLAEAFSEDIWMVGYNLMGEPLPHWGLILLFAGGLCREGAADRKAPAECRAVPPPGPKAPGNPGV